LEEISPEEFNQIIQANICGTFYLSREILPQMRKQKFGRIINIGHACAERIRAYKTETPYYISKTGILILTKSLATQEAPHGITCNMISPGVMINNTYFPADIFRNIPMGRLAQFEDFMGALDFLLSDQAHYITGTAIDVSGGFNL
jgi:3-oxoacyl-[acyl-carrier protein] reductase